MLVMCLQIKLVRYETEKITLRNYRIIQEVSSIQFYYIAMTFKMATKTTDPTGQCLKINYLLPYCQNK